MDTQDHLSLFASAASTPILGLSCLTRHKND